MKKLNALVLGLGAIAVLVGCSNGPTTDEAKVRKLLDGPPSLEGMAKKHPTGARENEKNKMATAPGAGGTGAAPAAGTP